MASYERDSLITTKDDNGDLNIIYPVTRMSAVYDLENATETKDGLLSSSDKAKINSISYIVNKDDSGFYIEI